MDFAGRIVELNAIVGKSMRLPIYVIVREVKAEISLCRPQFSMTSTKFKAFNLCRVCVTFQGLRKNWHKNGTF